MAVRTADGTVGRSDPGVDEEHALRRTAVMHMAIGTFTTPAATASSSVALSTRRSRPAAVA